VRLLSGKLDRIGSTSATLLIEDQTGRQRSPIQIKATDHQSAMELLLDLLETEPLFAALHTVSHRIVHGMKHTEPARVTAQLIAELHRITHFAPDHLPREISLIEAFRKRYPKLLQVACFDTAFHRTMPPIARLLAIPRRYASRGVERYGFHGLSYAYLIEELHNLDPRVAQGRVILAHLGNGASIAALHNGRSVDTSMGLTPAAGLVMSSRTGDVDPGLIGYLTRIENMTADGFEHMANFESGLLGVSGISSDMRDLLAKEAASVRAAEAIELFAYQAKKWIGSFAAVLGGIDGLVFAGGVGENAPTVRARICKGLAYLGIILDKRRNSRNASVISSDGGVVSVRVIPTNEELMLARLAMRMPGKKRTPIGC
jgi:acetate kinase